MSAEHEEARARFPVLDRYAYLNAGTVGPLSTASHRAQAEWEERALREGRSGKTYFDDGDQLRRRVRERLATLLAVPADRLVLTASTTEGCNIVVTGLRLEPQDEVVTTDAEHPGLLSPLQASGATVRFASVLGKTAAQALDAIVGAVTPHTRLIAISHALFISGEVMPIAEIRRSTGVPLLVDGAQSAGAIPVEAAVAAADFYAMSGQKWLCGPEGTGALHVADPDRLRPQMGGFQAMFGQGVDRLGVLHHPAAAMAGLLAALEERPDWAYARAAEMTARCRAALIAAGHQVHTPPDASGLIALSPPAGAAAEDVVAACRERGVVLRALHNGWIRVSCGWWTADDDMARLVEVLGEIDAHASQP
ncbi:MAG TPA: aminotransferase class V-fold PLP-dependent enzyme [Candidatus Dormibacteraeota bacterium]|nr:aminotransferase class V-fold PLP-dependent enzyme [Candidatus Dormibacteraeota bacterium]